LKCDKPLEEIFETATQVCGSFNKYNFDLISNSLKRVHKSGFVQVMESLEFVISISRPGKSWNLHVSEGHGKAMCLAKGCKL